MNRDALAKMTLESLRTLAVERGLAAAGGLGRRQLIEQLIDGGEGADAAPANDAAEPAGMLDVEEPPERYGTCQCTLLLQEPARAFAYWEVTAAGVAAARAQLGAAGEGARRVLRVTTVEQGGAAEVVDLDAEEQGHRYLASLRPATEVRVALGLAGEGAFAVIAESAPVATPPVLPATAGVLEWVDVSPARSDGAAEPPVVVPCRPEYTERGVHAVEVTAGPAPGSSLATWRFEGTADAKA